MLKEHLKYTDFNGEEREQDFYFNLSQAELTEMQLGQRGGMEQYFTNIINNGDQRKMIDVLKSFIRASFGVRSEDGSAFIKSLETWQVFYGSGAYESLFLSMVDNPDKMLDFITGIVPEKLRSNMAAQRAEATATPGFRPGADTSRPTPPVAGGDPAAAAQPVATAGDGGVAQQPAEPATPVSAQPAATPNDPQEFQAPADAPQQPAVTPVEPVPAVPSTPVQEPQPSAPVANPAEGFTPSESAYIPPEDQPQQ